VSIERLDYMNLPGNSSLVRRRPNPAVELDLIAKRAFLRSRSHSADIGSRRDRPVPIGQSLLAVARKPLKMTAGQTIG